MLTDPDHPQFVHEDVVRIAGTSAKTLHNWIDPTRAIIRLASPRPGKGVRRLYSALDVCVVTLAVNLTNLGVTPVTVATLFYGEDRGTSIIDTLRDAWNRMDSEVFCDIEIVGGKMIVSVFTGESAAPDRSDISNRRFAFIRINLNAIVTYARQQLEDILLLEADENSLSPQEKAVFNLRKHMASMPKKD